MTTDCERAYAAGLIDGEGTIQLKKKGNEKKWDSDWRGLVVEISNTDARMVAWMEQRFGGAISYQKRPKDTKRKDAYIWRVGGAKALKILNQLQAYLVTKRRHVEVVFQFRAFVGASGHNLTEEQREGKRRAIKRLDQLNKRGR